MPQEIIKRFLSGEMDIVEFRRLYDTDPAINDFLQKIIDELKADPGRKTVPYIYHMSGRDIPITATVDALRDPGLDPARQRRYGSVRALLGDCDVQTAQGATNLYGYVYEIHLQIEPQMPRYDRYSEEYGFALDVIPAYLEGGASEHYIQKHILPLYPATMKKGERKKAVKAAIREAFKSEKGYPAWPQHSEWPMGADGRPATYIGKGKSEGDLRRFRFRDESTGEIITVEQCY